MRKIIVLLVGLASSVGISSFTQAQTSWPDHPIRLIVPTGPGSATDLMARLLANEVSKDVGNMYIENIPGASGILAHQATARAAADGYTFLFTNNSGMAINPVSFKQLPYDPTKDFATVAIVSDLGPQALSVNKDFPAKTLSDVIAYGKGHPGKLDYAVDATVGSAVFTGRLLKLRAGIDMSEVAYRSTAQMLQDVAAGQVPLLISSVVAAQGFVDKGDLRRIAIFSGRRFPGLPDLPTVDETLPGTIIDGFFGVVAPKGTPSPMIERINQAVASFLKAPDIKQRLHDIGLDSSGPRTPEQSAEFIADQQQHWRDLAKELKIEAQ
jgi:tripartite-type tricarboxylate transporter receptor subunit TctC